MVKKIFFFIFCSIAPLFVFSQNPPLKSIGELQWIIVNFLHTDTAGKFTGSENAAPEAFLFVANIDSNGIVNKTQVLGEDKFTDTAYAILGKMKPVDFKDWKGSSYVGKTLIIPVTIIPPAMDFRELDKISGLGGFNKGEIGNMIITRSIALFLSYEMKGMATGRVEKIDTPKTQN